MRIYWFKAQAPQRVLALVKHLGIHAELIEVDMMGGGLRAPAYVALNPNMKAPVLVEDGPDGERVTWEASAIMARLCILAGSDMWPAHAPDEQVEVLRWLSWNDSHWGPVVSHFYFELVVKTTFRFAEPDLESLKQPSLLADLERFASVLDGHLAGRDFVACGRLTIADFQLAAMAMYWRETTMPIERFTNIVRWLDGLQRIPAWAEPWPPSKYT